MSEPATSPSDHGAAPAERSSETPAIETPAENQPATDDGALLENEESGALDADDLAADEPEPTLAVPEERQSTRISQRR